MSKVIWLYACGALALIILIALAAGVLASDRGVFLSYSVDEFHAASVWQVRLDRALGRDRAPVIVWQQGRGYGVC